MPWEPTRPWCEILVRSGDSTYIIVVVAVDISVESALPATSMFISGNKDILQVFLGNALVFSIDSLTGKDLGERSSV